MTTEVDEIAGEDEVEVGETVAVVSESVLEAVVVAVDSLAAVEVGSTDSVNESVFDAVVEVGSAVVKVWLNAEDEVGMGVSSDRVPVSVVGAAVVLVGSTIQVELVPVADDDTAESVIEAVAVVRTSVRVESSESVEVEAAESVADEPGRSVTVDSSGSVVVALGAAEPVETVGWSSVAVDRSESVMVELGASVPVAVEPGASVPVAVDAEAVGVTSGAAAVSSTQIVS